MGDKKSNWPISKVIQVPISGDFSQPIGWGVNVYDLENYPIGGGTHVNARTAQLIAYHEMIERNIFHKYLREKNETLFLDQNPTTCGMAVGQDVYKTKLRSIGEAIERWAWSKWIDENYYIPKIDVDLKQLGPLATYYQSFFDEVIFHYFEFPTQLLLGKKLRPRILIGLGIKGNGIFPGSRLSFDDEDKYDHALVESWRNLMISESLSRQLTPPHSFIDKRILFFGKNKDVAFEQIAKAEKKDWPAIQFKLMAKEMDTGISKIKMYRSLCSNYLGWSEGDVSRFVY